jgi:glycosyltransferase involved in cell wall biosynthesis
MERLKADWWLRNVSFHDPVTPDRLASFFSIAECGLVSLRDIPMHNGARPSKIFPILASGKPIVFVGRGEGAELIARADAGVVVSPGDPSALAGAITTMFEQPEIMKQRGVNGRRFVEANLTWSKLVTDWICQLGRSNSEYEAERRTSLRNDVIPIQRETS